MTDTALQDLPPFAGHSPEQQRPLGSYAFVMGAFLTAGTGFAAWLRSSGRELPEEIDNRDLALVAIATFKASRLVTRDRITSAVRAPFTRYQDDAGPSEVNEAARGAGLRRAVGELLVCPYCLDMWTATLLLGGMVVAPRAARFVASVFAVLAGADVLQMAHARAESGLH